MIHVMLIVLSITFTKTAPSINYASVHVSFTLIGSFVTGECEHGTELT